MGPSARHSGEDQGAKRWQDATTPGERRLQRLLAAAAKGDVLDRCLFTPLAAATGAPGNSTALVGSPETVASALLDYAGIGVDTFLIRGYEPFNDCIDYGARLLPLVRSKMAEHEHHLTTV